MAFLRPSTGFSMPWERTSSLSSQKGWFIHYVAAHHLRLGSRPLLLVHMLPFTAQEWCSYKGSHSVTNDQLLLVVLWCLHCRNKGSSTRIICSWIALFFSAQWAWYSPSSPLHAHPALSQGPEIPPPAQVGSSICQSWTSCWLSEWPATLNAKQNSHGRTLLFFLRNANLLKHFEDICCQMHV